MQEPVAIVCIMNEIKMSYAEIARKVGVTGEAVRKWFLSGVPAERVLSVSQATDWRVTPHELRQDIYPNQLDGLPPKVARRKKVAS